MMDKVYKCDPNKNTECNKKGCLYNPMSDHPVCGHTTHKEYALDKDNKC